MKTMISYVPFPSNPVQFSSRSRCVTPSRPKFITFRSFFVVNPLNTPGEDTIVPFILFAILDTTLCTFTPSLFISSAPPPTIIMRRLALFIILAEFSAARLKASFGPLTSEVSPASICGKLLSPQYHSIK